MFDREGRRLRYAKDDDVETVASMVREEHILRVNPDEEYATNIMKTKMFDTDLERMDDLAVTLADKPLNKQSKERWEEKQRRKALRGNSHDQYLVFLFL
jgi:hypothetical protein